MTSACDKDARGVGQHEGGAVNVAILAGGVGTRLAEETEIRPKPMVEIGGKPLLWHIMKHYRVYGYKKFVVALGYKGECIKRYFVEDTILSPNLTVFPATGKVIPHGLPPEDWKIELVDTGKATLTGGRIRRLAPYLGDETFFLTWGDGVSNVDLGKLLDFHRSHGKLCTLTAVRPPARFGHLDIQGDAIQEFSEKPQTGEGWINGAFFVCEPGVFNYIEGDETQWERQPLEQLAKDGELMAYKHTGFWQCMDTLRDKRLLAELWEGDEAMWKTWKD